MSSTFALHWPRPSPGLRAGGLTKTLLRRRAVACRMAPRTTEHIMPDSEADLTAAHQPAGRFPPTHWTVVMDAGKDSSPNARDAFGELYRAYLTPLIAF